MSKELTQIEKARLDGVAAGMEAAAGEVPTSWLDPLLSGKDASIGYPITGPAVERLLRKIAERIRSRKPADVVLWPEEPTEAVIHAVVYLLAGNISKDVARRLYKAMRAAAMKESAKEPR